MSPDPQRAPCCSVEALCAAAGFSRQAYYRGRAREQHRKERDEQALEAVQELRRDLPRLGTRKLYHEQYARFRALGLGRDLLFALLRREGLLIQRRRRSAQTTDARHGFGVADNLLLDPKTGVAYRPVRPNEVFVADITYVETIEGFRYAALVTDAYSRKIVGFDLSASLSVEGSLRALEMALSQTTKRERCCLIHHADRGVQYCCRAYRQRLARVGARASMSATGDPYENALAERVNGILKMELGLDALFLSEAQARRALKQAVRLYNERRPHLSLAYRKPSEVHAEHRLAG